MWDEAHALGLEPVVRVSESDDIERALERFDPGVFLLSAPPDSDDDPLALLLGLLHDVPAGKLAIAELHDATAEDVAELERSGVDAVLVAPADVAALVPDDPPDVARSRADRDPDGRRRLPWVERRDPCRRTKIDRSRSRDGRRPRWVEGVDRGNLQPPRPARGVGNPSSRGTILGTTRTNPYKVEGGVEAVLREFEKERLDALVAIGGEDTLGVAARLYREHEFPVVGVPKTIDNDLSGTDYTFGFDTAVAIATEAIDRLHTTAESHNRVMVVEVMGRNTGWIAVMSGIAGGADMILIPEQPVTVEDACKELVKRHEGGKDFSIVVVSEGYELTYESGSTGASRERRVRPTSSATSSSAVSGMLWLAGSKSERDSRRVSRCSGTSSAAEPRRRATESLRRDSA